MIYFVQNSDELKIGFTDDLSSRLSTLRQYGFDLICAMPGSSEDEGRIHSHFSCWNKRGKDYFSKSEEIYCYIERLLEKRFAHPDQDVAEHLSALPFSIWGPNNIGNGGAIEVNGQHSIFDLMPVKERVALLSRQLQNSSVTDEWHSPKELVDLALKALGQIDTDPATDSGVNSKWIRASVFYTKYTNGLDLSRPWMGNVWLNPPYGRGEGSAGDFIYRLGNELTADNVQQALTCLSVASMSSKWFYSVVPKYVAAHCVMHGRPNFHPPQGVAATSSPTKGIVISYFGRNIDRFCDAFGKAGQILLPHKPKVA